MAWNPRPMSRRQMLQSATFGVAAIAAGSRLRLDARILDHVERAGVSLPANGDTELYRTFEGECLDRTSAGIDLAVAGRDQRISIPPSAAIWRGGTAKLADLQPGDRLLLKLADDWSVSNVWANLSRAGGYVSTLGSGAVQIKGEGATTVIQTAAQTQYSNSFSFSGGGSRKDLHEGVWVDAIGMAGRDGSLSGTLVSYADPALTPPLRTTAFDASVAPAATFLAYGRVTWFDCATGAGKCGTCNTSKNNQAAWPDTTNSNGSGRCQFDGCKGDYPTLHCGDGFSITPCNGSAASLVVADCGPCQKSGCPSAVCNGTCNNPASCGTVQGTVCDLTKPTFARFYNPASFGCFAAAVYV